MCGNLLQLMSSMKQRIEYVHYGNKLCRYTICVYSFKQESSLQQHKECVHESNAPYKFELCHKDGETIFNAMYLTNVNSVIKDLMEIIISIGILNQFMRKINRIKETFGM